MTESSVPAVTADAHPPLPDPGVITIRRPPGRFEFDGGAGTYIGTCILAFLVTTLTLGICAPWGICMRYRWRSKHTLIDGRRVVFTGSAWGLVGRWLLWWLLCIITIGIYGFWVAPRLTRWITEHQTYGRGPEFEQWRSVEPVMITDAGAARSSEFVGLSSNVRPLTGVEIQNVLSAVENTKAAGS